MKSSAETVEQYLEELTPERREAQLSTDWAVQGDGIFCHGASGCQPVQRRAMYRGEPMLISGDASAPYWVVSRSPLYYLPTEAGAEDLELMALIDQLCRDIVGEEPCLDPPHEHLCRRRKRAVVHRQLQGHREEAGHGEVVCAVQEPRRSAVEPDRRGDQPVPDGRVDSVLRIGHRSSTPTRAASSPARPSPACCCPKRSSELDGRDLVSRPTCRDADQLSSIPKLGVSLLVWRAEPVRRCSMTVPA